MDRAKFILENKQRIQILDKVCIILLALCPILQHYKGLFVNAAVTVLLIVTPYAILKMIGKRYIYLNDIRFVLPLIIYFFYKVVDHGTTVTELGQAVIFTILVITISGGCLNTKYFIRVITIISLLACICIIVQYLCYYFLHFHIQFVPTSLLLDRSNQWVLAAKTGRASITGRMTKFYRPSAFFLEPSHMFIYMFTPLVLNIFSNESGKKQRKISVLLTIGMILSTSGMGIITAIGVWIIYFGKKNGVFSLANFLLPKTILIVFIMVLGIVIMYFKIPFFQNSIMRIFGSGHDYTNAIIGRVSSGKNLISQIRGTQLLVGVEDHLTGIEFNMSGFNATMYQFGIIGIILSYIFYIKGIFRLKGAYTLISIIIIVLSFFSSHTHSTMFMIYSTFIFVDGYQNKTFNCSESLTKTHHNTLFEQFE